MGLLTLLRRRNRPGPLSASLTAYWAMEGAAGAAESDLIGSSHLAQAGGAGSAAGRVANARSFVTASAQALSCASSAALQAGDIDFGITAWVWLDTKAADQVFVAKYNFGASQREYILRYLVASDRLNFTVSADGTATASVSANNHGSPPTGQWLFLTAWHDSVANTINLAVNDGAANSVAHSTGILAGASDFQVGRFPSGSYLNGRVDELALWKPYPTAAGRTWLYNAGAGRDLPAIRGYRG